jgi:hypothetical protein
VTLEELIIKIRADAQGVSTTLAKTKSDIKGVEDQAVQSKRGLSSIFDGVGKGAMVAAAGLAAGAAIVAKSMDTFAAYGKEVKDIQRLTGATAEQASTIVGQLKLVGGQEVDASEALGRWAVNLAAARDATSAQAKVMADLGISLQDANGQWRSSADVLMDFRDKISGVTDATLRAQDLQAMMGRGYKSILPWFTEGKAKMDEYTKSLKDMGMVLSKQDMDTWGKYMGDERMMGMLMTALQIKVALLASSLIGPLANAANKVMAILTRVPTPIIKITAGIAGLWAVMKVGGAVVTMTKNIMKLTGVIGELTGADAQTVRAFVRYIAKVPEMIAANMSLALSYGAIAAAAAATSMAIYGAIQAFQSMQEAIGQANQAENEALQNNEAAYEAGKISQATYESNRASILKDRSSGMVRWYNPSSWFWHGEGGNFVANKPTVIGVGERGREAISITPLTKAKAGAGATFQFHIDALYARDEADAEAAARRIMSKVIAIQAAT